MSDSGTTDSDSAQQGRSAHEGLRHVDLTAEAVAWEMLRRVRQIGGDSSMTSGDLVRGALEAVDAEAQAGRLGIFVWSHYVDPESLLNS